MEASSWQLSLTVVQSTNKETSLLAMSIYNLLSLQNSYICEYLGVSIYIILNSFPRDTIVGGKSDPEALDLT